MLILCLVGDLFVMGSGAWLFFTKDREIGLFLAGSASTPLIWLVVKLIGGGA